MTDLNATSIGVLVAGGIAISATKVSGVGIRIAGTKNTDAGWIEVRAQRNALLAASDWTQMPDVEHDPDTRAAWVVYRQALRNVTEVGHVGKVEWPTPPAKRAPTTPATGA